MLLGLFLLRLFLLLSAEASDMTGNLQAIGFLFTWVLGWGIGGSLIDAGLIQAGVYSLETGQLGTATTFVLWSLFWGGAGFSLYRRFTQSSADSAGGDS